MFKSYKQLFKFFGQYIRSEELSVIEQLNPYFKEFDIEHHRLAVSKLKEFLNEDFTLTQKESLVQGSININFDTKRHTPMLLTTSILTAIESRIARIEKREKEQEELLRKYRHLIDFLSQFQCNRQHTPEDVLNEFFNKSQPEFWKEIEGLIREFLADDISKRKQNAIINQFVAIDFHYRNTPPTLWLKGIANSIVYRLNWIELGND